jgi:hypothetical protein
LSKLSSEKSIENEMPLRMTSLPSWKVPTKIASTGTSEISAITIRKAPWMSAAVLRLMPGRDASTAEVRSGLMAVC